MKLSLTFAALVALVAVLVVGVPLRAEKYPEPSPYPITWEFDFQHQTPARIVVDVPNSPATKAYWYMTYTVTNEGEETQTFIPQFELLAHDGKVYKANRDVPKYVFNAIKQRERNELLLPPTRAGGELRPGVDQARESVAVWEEPDQDMDTFRIYVGGLSGEFVELKNSEGKLLKDAKGEQIILRKTLQLTFHTKGDEVHPGDPDPVSEGEGKTGRNKKDWVMR